MFNQNFRTYHLAVALYRKCLELSLPLYLKDQILPKDEAKAALKTQNEFLKLPLAA